MEDRAENRGLIFIPDISGFTQFVTETEIGHSRLIIQELLETLINANSVGLAVSEIEGDAILFYRFGEMPELSEIYKQIETMFFAFHRQLAVYEINRYCQCKACTAAMNLTLKVITHYGEFTGYSVKSFNKLIGKDVIVAHQLLKNDIPHREYWLATGSVLENETPRGLTCGMQWNEGEKKTETGSVRFHFTPLSSLRDQVPPQQPLMFSASGKSKEISLSRNYETHLITLLHATGDLNYRHRWMNGVKQVEHIRHFLPRVGMKTRLIMDNGDSVVYASSYSFRPEKVEFSETEEKTQDVMYFTLEKVDENTTRLVIDYYITGGFIDKMIFRMTRKKKIQELLQASMSNLEAFAKELKVPVAY